jgi:conjugative transfer region protein TrbK
MRPGPRTLARVAALGLVAAALVAALRSGGDGPAGGVVTHPRPDDPLAVELRRCAALGRAAQDDWLCKRLAEVPSPPRPGDAATPKDQSRLPPDQARPQAGRPEEE